MANASCFAELVTQFCHSGLLNMATITKRKTGWSVQVRRKGYAARSKTFPTYTAALAWAREQEAAMDKGVASIGFAELRSTTLKSLIERYLVEVTPRKRSHNSEELRLRKISQHPIAMHSMRTLAKHHLAAYRDERLEVVKPGTVRRELGLLHHIFDVAMREWDLPILVNPLKSISLPSLSNARSRRLEPGEFERLVNALKACRNEEVLPIVMLAIETGLRRREVLELEWANINLERSTAFIPFTKTGVPRTIPLTDGGIEIISGLPRKGERLFLTSANAFKMAWRRVQNRAKLSDLRFHDLRHEALSRFCELGLSIPELAVISGHRDPRMLFRYAHLRADELASKIQAMSRLE